MLWKTSLRFCKYTWLRTRHSSTTSIDTRGASHMVWSTDVLTTVSSDTEPSLLLTFDSKYAFNAGENIGRAMGQRGSGRKGFKTIFLTSIGTQRGSGLPGLTMFLADAAVQDLTIIGPHGLNHHIATMRTYLWRDNVCVNPIEIETAPCRRYTEAPQPVYTDANMTVYGIHLSPGPFPDQSPELVENNATMSFNKRRRSPSPLASNKRQEVDPSSSTSTEAATEAAEDAQTTNAVEEVEMEKVTEAEATETAQAQQAPRVYKPKQPREIDSYMSPSLAASFSTWGFSPSYLKGEDAKEWLKLTIQNMFPKEQSVPQSKHRKHRQKSQPEPKAAAEPSTSAPEERKMKYGASKYPKLVWHKERKLPKFIPEISNSSDPAMKATMCYVVVGPRYRGKFDVKKAEALGLNGKNRGRVCAGGTVTYTVKDGNGGTITRTVSMDDVVGASEPPKVVIVLDVPSPAHIPDLTTAFENNPVYTRIRSKKPADHEEYSTYIVYHILGAGVLEDPRYKEFMNGFDDSVHHIVGSKEHSPDPVTFTNVGGLQLKLNKLDRDMFPLPYHRLQAAKELSSVTGLPPNVHLMTNKLTADCRPVKPPRDIEGLRDDFHPFVSNQEGIRLSREMSDALYKARARSRSLSPPRSPSGKKSAPPRRPRRGDDVVVVPLGTSSAIPSMYRNVSATLIRIPNYGTILLDCGEGTWGQLIRLYGDDPEHKSGVWEVLRDIKCIFTSHVHGDHHIGLAKILSMRTQMKVPPTSPLWVVGLHHHLLYMKELHELENLGLDNSDGNGVIPVLSDALCATPPRPYYSGVLVEKLDWLDANLARTRAKAMCASLGLAKFTTVIMDHGTRCYGAVIRHLDQWDIAFSADTKPTETLVAAGRGVRLLIHEATMGDDEKEAAKKKAHSTFGQAVDIGKRMEASNILLTHFSSRYPKMPSTSMTGDAPNWAIAMDHAVVPIRDMLKLRAYIPAIQRCFEEAPVSEEEEEEMRQADNWR